MVFSCATLFSFPPHRLPPPPKKALIIGCNYSDAPRGAPYAPLRFAQRDAKALGQLLVEVYHFKPENVTIMLDDNSVHPSLHPTRDNIMKRLHKLVHGAREGSRFVLLYTGHSGQVTSLTTEEEDGLDEFIVPVDHSQPSSCAGSDEKTRKRMIVDNTLREILVDPLPRGAHLTAIFDSCHSGTLLDLNHYACLNRNRRCMSCRKRARKRSGVFMNGAYVSRTSDPLRSGGSLSSQNGMVSSVRVVQRKSVSADPGHLELVDTSVGVSEMGERKEHRVVSVQSVQSGSGSGSSTTCTGSTTTASLAQMVVECEGRRVDISTQDALVSETVNDAGEIYGRRCASPTPLFRSCPGFCVPTAGPPSGGTVLSISSCHDSQTTFEGKSGTFVQWLIQHLRADPHPLTDQLVQDLGRKMHEDGEARRNHFRRKKDSLLEKHKKTPNANIMEELERWRSVESGVPQLGAQHCADLTERFDF